MLRDANGLTEEEFLEQYKPGDYPRPSMTADVIILSPVSKQISEWNEADILLIRRGGHPCLGQWALPGGFVNPDETTLQAAYRELLEETGVKGISLEQLDVFSDPGRDPRTWVITSAHLAVANRQKLAIQAGDDASDARWFRLRWCCVNTENADLTVSSIVKTYELALDNDDEKLSAKVQHIYPVNHIVPTGYFDIIQNNGLAFDHAKVILCAIRRYELKEFITRY